MSLDGLGFDSAVACQVQRLAVIAVAGVSSRIRAEVALLLVGKLCHSTQPRNLRFGIII